jgi:hypothetical protein
MRRFLVTLLIALAVTLIQPLILAKFGGQRWIFDFTPVFLVYASIRFSPFWLAGFILLGGLLHDILVPHAPGMGPLIWGCTIFLVRSQRLWIRDRSWSMLMLRGWAASFFYIGLERLLFLASQGFWSWNLELSVKMLTLSIVNAFVCPLVVKVIDRLTRPAVHDSFRDSLSLNVAR